MINWTVELLELVSLQQEKERVSGGQSPACAFSPAASEQAITQSEAAIGARLDQQHRDFLKHTNGWVGFSKSADIFSTDDFLGSSSFKTAQEWIKQMDRGVLGQYAKKRHLLLPIGKSSASTDLLLMLKDGDQVQPKVLWFTNELVEEFDSFEQMFASFKSYARSAIEYWRRRNTAA